MSGDVFLNIDRIVLHGMEHVDGKALAAAVQQSLLEQLIESPIHDPATQARVRAQISLPESCNAAQMGKALAQSLHGIIGTNAATVEKGPTGGQGGQGDA